VLADGGEALVFTQTWPGGASNTAVGPPVPKVSNKLPVDLTANQEQVSSVFPAISPITRGGSAQSYMLYYDQMVGGMENGTRYGQWGDGTSSLVGGTMGGPLTVWGKSSISIDCPSRKQIAPGCAHADDHACTRAKNIPMHVHVHVYITMHVHMHAHAHYMQIPM
jgi:hypothetical protein